MQSGKILIRLVSTQLANAAGISDANIRKTLKRRTANQAVEPILDEIVAALESAGVEFTNGDAPGVRLRKKAE